MRTCPQLRCAAALIALLAATPGAAIDRAPAPQPVDAAGLRQLLDEQSGRVVLLNFWATWCRPCLKEIPALQELAARYADAGLVLVPVSLDEPASAAGVLVPFLDRWFPDFATWLSMEPEMDSVVSVVDPAWNEVLPTTYVIGRDGEVHQRLQGGKPAEVFEAAVQGALQR